MYSTSSLQENRNYLIIAGSTIFYAWWKVEYVWVPYLLMAIAYFGVQWIAGAREHTARKGRMLITVILLFLPLLFFKYTSIPSVSEKWLAKAGGNDSCCGHDSRRLS